MSIEYIADKKLFHIKTLNSSYIFRVRKKYALEHLYYGKRIDDLSGIEYLSDENYLGATLHAIDAEFAEEKLSTGRMCVEYPFYGSVDMRQPAFHAVYSDGSRVTKMYYDGHSIFCGKPKLDGLPSTYASEEEAQTVEITMLRKKYFCFFDLYCTEWGKFTRVINSRRRRGISICCCHLVWLKEENPKYLGAVGTITVSQAGDGACLSASE